ncbi:MAG: hypothetical protein ACXWKG_15205 [Limisphaerales bacterium]
MKRLLTNLLIVLALALCGLVAVQWVREAQLRQQLQAVSDSLHDKSEVLGHVRDQLKHSEDEIQRLEKVRIDLSEQAKTNAFLTLDLRKQLDQARADTERQTLSADNYKAALEHANQNVTKQNRDIEKQNDDLKKLAQERNDIVTRYNKLAKDFDDLTKKWNDQQAELARRASKQ